MDQELLVADTVRRWAGRSFPSDPALADAAAAAALRALAGGASVSEASREGRRYIDCCRRHPSTAIGRKDGRRQVA